MITPERIKELFEYHSDGFLIEFAELVAIEARNKYHGQYARHF